MGWLRFQATSPQRNVDFGFTGSGSGPMQFIPGYSVHQGVKLLLTKKLISCGNVLNDDADAEISSSSSDV